MRTVRASASGGVLRCIRAARARVDGIVEDYVFVGTIVTAEANPQPKLATLDSGLVRSWKIGWTISLWLLIIAVSCFVRAPRPSWACACGCGIYEVGTASLYPHGAGGTLWFEYDFMDQYQNWHESKQAPASQNDDKDLRTNFLTLGGQYMFNRDWGVMLQIPYWYRHFRTTTDDGDVKSFDWGSVGDIRIAGMYTGLSEDMSTGLLAGVKVPSGDWTYPNADRDTQIGTGSTDLLLGAYQLGTIPRLTFKDRPFGWYGQLYYDLPLWAQDHYTPGREFDAALGTYYDFGTVGFLSELAPTLVFKWSDRTRDSGSAADPPNTGYDRLFLGPGGEIKIGDVRLYADVEFPIYQNMVGNQLVAPVLVKTVLSYDFY